MKTEIKTIFMLCAMAVITACGTNNNDNHDTDRDTVVINNGEVNDAEYEREQSEFRNDLNRQLDTLDKKIERLDEKIRTQKGEERKRSEAKRDELKQESRDIRGRMDQSDDRTKEEWKEFKSSVETEMDQFGKKVDRFFEDDKEIEVEVKNER